MDPEDFHLSLETCRRPIFRFGINERYEDILKGGHTIVTDSEELTFIWRENMEYPEFKRVYTSKFKWTNGNIVGHMYKLIDEYLAFHNEYSDYFADRCIYGFSYNPRKEEIYILDES